MAPNPGRHTVTGSSGAAPPAHASRPPVPLTRLIAISAGGLVAIGLAGLGVSTYFSDADPSTSTPTSASLMTVAPQSLVPAHR